MNNKAVTLSLMMAVLAIFFVNSYVGSIEDETKRRFGVEVLVLKAKKDIKEQESINETMIAALPVPKTFLEPSAIYFEKVKDEKETSKAIKALIGMVALVPIKQGEQLTQNKIIDPGVRTGLSPQVTPGKRAVAVPVTEISGVSKLVKPGDRVDVLAVLDSGGGKQNKMVKTILQDVVVLAVGKNVTNNVARAIEVDGFSKTERIRPLAEDTSFATVTLEVEPAQAQILALTAATGDHQITLSLRNNDDTDRVALSATMLIDLLGGDAARTERAPAGRR